MTLEEAGPVAAFSLGAGLDTVLVEYVLDGCAADFVALAELRELAMDAGVTPGGILLGEADDQLTDVVWKRRAAGRILLARIDRVPTPAQ